MRRFLISIAISLLCVSQSVADGCGDAKNAFSAFDNKSGDRFTSAVNNAPKPHDKASMLEFYKALCKAHTDSLTESSELRKLMTAAVEACKMPDAEAASWKKAFESTVEQTRNDVEDYCARAGTPKR